jgi:hypothetical protein
VQVDEERWRQELDKELDDFLAEDEAIPERTIEIVGEENVLDIVHVPLSISNATFQRAPPSPPSKMRSDYIGNDGRTLLERTSLLRYHPLGSDPLDVASDGPRLILPLPRRQRGGRGRRNGELVNDADSLSLEDRIHPTHEDSHKWGGRMAAVIGPREERRERRQKGGERPVKSQQELDDELDAFLNGKD